MHKQSYSQYFYRVLLDFHKVNIPGLGLFSLVQHTAELSSDKHSIIPPSSRVQFNTFEDSRYNISKLLVEAGLDKSLSSGIEKFYESKVQLSRESNLPFTIEGLGKVISNSFLPDNDSVFNLYDGLDNIKILPLASGFKNIVHDEEYLYNLSKSQSVRKHASFTEQYLWPLIVGLVTLFVILFWMFSPKVDQNSTIHKPVENIVQTAMADTVFAEDTILESNINALDTLVAIDEEDNVEPEPIIKDEPKIVHSVKKPTKSDNQSCIIIVGAFKNYANAQRMVKNISKKGYDTFTSEHQGLKRVGVRYDCQSTSPDEFKTKIRSQFNREAWSLSDTI